ncbi:FixH family protein [Ralstonia solanacearum]|uniref:Hypothetical lipoprotein n=1 Tax=Ralstonia solanacearum (strain Po82) TaxID=1031711 RepID=F6G223_RALS8|nr:FixH family protein [Ralstonia solanacearum]AEG69378.1 hypothetical lipoprotein [Ralstonia solanacearum Po82]AMP70336.1 hypothetical protein UW163_13085 [Ralstonia solanacearum]AMP75503.1 hypothetical protein RALBFv3_15620 [Ralstonia solanacearum]EUJ14592.1 membrane protein [Ralstonia solanacearum P673]MBB6587563.1 FixH family protein [Ralstonia solanacearum]
MQAIQPSAAQARPWWREPWPWLLMAGPFVAMIGCGVTIWLAATHPDPVVQDNVVRRGLVVEKAVSVPAHAVHGAVR